MPRPPKKRGGASKDAEEGGRVPVVVAMQRGSRITTDRMLPDPTAVSLGYVQVTC